MSSGMPLQTSGYGGGYDPSLSSASLSASNQSSYPTSIGPSEDSVEFSSKPDKPEKKKSHVWAWVGGIAGVITAILAAIGLHSAVGQARIRSLAQEYKNKDIDPLLKCFTREDGKSKLNENDPAFKAVSNKKGATLLGSHLMESSHEEFIQLMNRRKADFGDDNYAKIITYHSQHGKKPETEKTAGDSQSS